MKITAISDIHGREFPKIEKCDVVCICGDIMPLYIQSDMIKSIVWFTGTFIPWCMSLPCDKVILIGGNHDFMYQAIIKRAFLYRDASDAEIDDMSAHAIDDKLLLPEKVVYLQDTSYTYNGVVFYGTPWCPNLANWAFYKSSEGLTERFEKMPDVIDVLLTHSPGSSMGDTDVSHFSDGHTERYGCDELTAAVSKRYVGHWFCGHVHTGNHELTDVGSTIVANVSMLSEDYAPTYEPLVVEI